MRALISKAALLLGDVAILFAALALAMLVRRPELFSIHYVFRHFRVFSFVFPIWILIFSSFDLYDFRQIVDLPTLTGDMIVAVVLSLALSTGVFYFFPEQLLSPKTYLYLTGLGVCVMGLAWRRLWISFLSSDMLSYRVALIGANSLIEYVNDDMKRRQFSNYRLVPEARLRGLCDRASGTLARGMGEDANLSSILDILIIDGERLEEEFNFASDLISLAISQEIPVWTHYDFYEHLYGKIPAELGRKPVWLLTNVLRRQKAGYILFKRLAETVLAAIALLCSAPLIVIAALLIKVFDGGNVLYSQQRLGYLNKEFKFWKFRTMLSGSEKQGYLWGVKGADRRVTPIGRWLRRYRIDEIPQLWNVCRGDMSLVGPRPTWVGETQALNLPHYHLRHLVKPGLTGWAQINYRSTDSFDDTVEKLQFDLYYVKNLSLGLDIAIILKTVRRLFQSENHFGGKRVTAPRPGVSSVPVMTEDAG